MGMCLEDESDKQNNLSLDPGIRVSGGNRGWTWHVHQTRHDRHHNTLTVCSIIRQFLPNTAGLNTAFSLDCHFKTVSANDTRGNFSKRGSSVRV